jgi:type IV secretory pathway VirB2 component (pilin)
MFYCKLVSSIFLFIFAISNAFSAIEFSEEESPKTLQNQPQAKSATTKAGAGATQNTKLILAENNPVAALMCKAIRGFTGTIAKIIAVFMTIGLGVSLLGHTPQNPVTPVTVVSVLIGVGILFSAETLIGLLTGEAGEGGGDYKRSCNCKYGLETDCENSI